MSKSAIYTLQNSSNKVLDGDTIPLGQIIRRYGQNIRQDGDVISLCDNKCGGYYKVDVVATLKLLDVANYFVSLQKDGVDVIGAVAREIAEDAPALKTFVISVLVRNTCASSNLSVKISGGSAKVKNMTIVVEKL